MIIQKLAYKGSFKKVPITLYYCTKMEKLSPFNQIRMEMLISLIVKLMLVSDRQVSHCLMMVGNVLGQDWNTAGCLNDTIDWYKRYVTIEGPCDERGTNEYNLALGERRAGSAKTFLMDLGIEGSRLKCISYGEERPVDPGHNEEAWA
jgi:hypothetical protein